MIHLKTKKKKLFVLAPKVDVIKIIVNALKMVKNAVFYVDALAVKIMIE